MEIRAAEEGDLLAILDIINYNIVHSTAIYDYKERTMEYQKVWFDDKKEANMPLIVAEEQGRVLGFGTYGVFRPREAYKYCVEHSVYVDNNFQGRGVGGKLLTQLINLAKSQGMRSMVAGIDGENEGSIKFHEKFGFRMAGRLSEVGYKFDRWLDLVFMQLML